MDEMKPLTYSEAKRYARWVKKYVRGASNIKVVESIDNGDSYVRYNNRANMPRFIRNLAEFSETKEMEA